MKIKVEYSESIQIAEGLWRKWGCEIEQESDTTETAEHLKCVVNEKVTRWHKETIATASPSFAGELFNGQIFAQQAAPPAIIDRSIERLEIMIDDCKTIEELNKVWDDNLDKISSNKSLSSLSELKMIELQKQIGGTI